MKKDYNRPVIIMKCCIGNILASSDPHSVDIYDDDDFTYGGKDL